MSWWLQQSGAMRVLLIGLILVLLACVCGLVVVVGLVLLSPERATPTPSPGPAPVTTPTGEGTATPEPEAEERETSEHRGELSPDETPVIQCTPPACQSGEVPRCPEEGDCPGGCGVVCVPLLPTIELN